ncbi:MAG: FAD/NAD(P)-binding protein [Rhodobacter sp.]|nr:FAD/NAD(P)-binding protein [Rhodobacter sp.]
MTHYVYIGGGATATSLLVQHVKRLAACDRQLLAGNSIQITILDRSGVFGPGVVYGSDVLPVHLLNMEARDMILDVDKPMAFSEWLEAKDAAGPVPAVPAAHRYASRHEFGEYLQIQLDETLCLASKIGVPVKLQKAEAIGLAALGPGPLAVECAHGERIVADRVVLATGHWDSGLTAHCEALGRQLRARSVGGLLHPWPAKDLQTAIPKDADVGVLGTSLTAFDVVLSLFDDCGTWRGLDTARPYYTPDPKPRRVTLYSRHGFLPWIRPVPPAAHHQTPEFTKESIEAAAEQRNGQVGFDELIEMFRRHLESYLGEAVGDQQAFWRDFLHSGGRGCGDVTDRAMLSLASALAAAEGPDDAWLRQYAGLRASYSPIVHAYRRLSAQDRQRFDLEFYPPFNARAAAIPALTGARVLELLRLGLVRVVAGLHEIKADVENEAFELRLGCEAGGQGRRFRWLVNAIGKDKSIALDKCRLLDEALRRGLISLHDAGGIRVDYEGSNVVDRHGRPSARIFAIGPMTIGERMGASSMASVSRFAGNLSEYFVGEIQAHAPDARLAPSIA